MHWLRELSLVAGSRRFGPDVLLFAGVVPRGDVRLEGVVDDPDLQQVQVEHFVAGRLIQIRVARVRRGRFFCHLELFRGHNDLSVAAFDTSGRVETRHVVYRPRLREWAEVLLIALSLAFILRAFLFQAFVIPSDSMKDVLRREDRILVDKLAYHLEPPRRGELVVFEDPRRPGTFFVKRVVGLPRETVMLAGSEVSIDGRRLEEPYLAPRPAPAGGPSGVHSATVPEGSYFVLGDDRQTTADSRDFGSLPVRRIVGRPILRYWPPDRIGGLAQEPLAGP